MYAHPYPLDLHLKHPHEHLEREIAHARLVAEATRHQRSLRTRVADALYALAALVEGQTAGRARRDELTATV